MIATLKRFLAPSPPPPPWVPLERELERLEPQVERLRAELDQAREAFVAADGAARIALDALAAADEAERPTARRAYQQAMTDRQRAGKRYKDLRAKWPAVSSRRRRLRDRVRILRLLEA